MTDRLSRRTVLRGLGTVVALPVARGDAAAPARAPTPQPRPPPRAAWPSSTSPTAATWKTGRRPRKGPTSSCPPILQPLAPHQATTCSS